MSLLYGLKPNTEKNMAECSEEFWDAFRSGHGSFYETCTCGRTYMATSEYRHDAGDEIEAFRAAVISEPGRNFDTGNMGIETADLGAMGTVHGCECGSERKHEDWVWSHRHQIADYLKARAKKEAAAADFTLSHVIGL